MAAAAAATCRLPLPPTSPTQPRWVPGGRPASRLYACRARACPRPACGPAAATDPVVVRRAAAHDRLPSCWTAPYRPSRACRCTHRRDLPCRQVRGRFFPLRLRTHVDIFLCVSRCFGLFAGMSFGSACGCTTGTSDALALAAAQREVYAMLGLSVPPSQASSALSVSAPIPMSAPVPDANGRGHGHGHTRPASELFHLHTGAHQERERGRRSRATQSVVDGVRARVHSFSRSALTLLLASSDFGRGHLSRVHVHHDVFYCTNTYALTYSFRRTPLDTGTDALRVGHQSVRLFISQPCRVGLHVYHRSTSHHT